MLYAANRGTDSAPGSIVVFDVKKREMLTRIPVEVNPYELLFAPGGKKLYVSNWPASL